MSQPAPSLTPAVFALLLALADGERHGYALMSDVEELTAGVVRLGPGTLYRSLQRMRVDGFIEELVVDDPPETAAPEAETPYDRRSERRRSYRLTEAGRDAARREAERLAVLVTAATTAGLLETKEIPR